MIQVTPTFALWVFVAILVISGVLAWWMKNYHTYDIGAFHTFISILMGLGVFVTFMFYFAIVSEQQDQKEVSSIQTLAEINTQLVNSVIKESNKAALIVPHFIISINPLTSQGLTASPDPVNAQTVVTKTTLSYRIFSVWQDIMITDFILTKYDQLSYLCNFLQRANSKELYQYWQAMRIDFNPETQRFGDLLFEYGLPITIQQPDSYLSQAKKLIKDPRFIELFN